MLLNPENYNYTRFKQNRTDGEEYGESGPLYIATHADGSKLLVKQMNAMDAANEYLACSLAQILGINTPKAWLFSSHKQIKRISFRHSVGIEFLDGLSLATKEDFLSCPNEAARCVILNLIADQEDGTSYGIYNGHIFTYDFGSTFTMGVNFQDNFLKLMKLPPDDLIQHLKNRRNSYRQYLNAAFDSITKSFLPVEIVEDEYVNIRNIFIDLTKSNGFEPIFDDIGKLYPKAIVEYYRSLLLELEEVFRDNPTIAAKSDGMTVYTAMLHIADALTEGKVKESRVYYGENADDIPPLSEFISNMELLLLHMPDIIKERYSIELNSIHNELMDYKNGHYYERLHSRGVPLITTIGKRIQTLTTDLFLKVTEDKPGAAEQIIKCSEQIFPKIPEN